MPIILDITVPISAGMVVWPGDPQVEIEPVARIAEGSTCNISRVCFSNHIGTHVDPPLHFIDGAGTVDNLPLDALIGPAYVAHIPNRNAISADDLQSANIPRTERLLLKTDNARFWPPQDSVFHEDFVHITPDAARWVVERGIRLIGIDYLSIQQFNAPTPDTHITLLYKGVVILEGVDLSKVEPGEYQLICLPLKIANGDGAPARAVLVR